MGIIRRRAIHRILIGALLAGGFLSLMQAVFTQNARAKTPQLAEAMEILRRIPRGAALLAKAQQQWPEGVENRIQWGGSSKTDAVLTRFYNSRTGEERRERKVSIWLRPQPLVALVLDLAHELEHATARPAWDPYDPNLTPVSYIRTAIEGPGGEVDAVLAECQVSLEMESHFGTSSERCRRYLEDDQKSASKAVLSRDKVLSDFYRTGQWKSSLTQQLHRQGFFLPGLSDANPVLFSSTGGTPYPVALLREYEDLTRIACENARRRQDTVTGAPERRPAASRSLDDLLQRRCLR